MGLVLCYQQLLLPVQANLSLVGFFLSSWQTSQMSCFSSRVVFALRKLQLERCRAYPAAFTLPSPRALLLGLQGRGMLPAPPPSTEPGRARGQLPPAFVKAQPPCDHRPGQPAAQGPGEEEVSGILPGAEVSLACRGVRWTNPPCPALPVWEPRAAEVPLLLRAG